MCNLCNKEIHEKYVRNLKINSLFIKDNIYDKIDYRCSNCNSVLRDRILQKILHNNIHERDSVFGCSINVRQTRIISKYLNIERNVDLYERANCESNVDITKPIKTDKKYKYFITIGVFELIYELENTFKNIYDILENDGKLIFWIPKWSYENKEYLEITIKKTFDQEKNFKPDKGICEVMFSYSWLEETLNKLGFDLKCYTLTDCLTDFEDNYFIASKK